MLLIAGGCREFVPLDDRIGVNASRVRAEAEQEPRLVERKQFGPEGRLLRSWSEWVIPGEPRRKHGVERHWSSGGQLTVERGWEDGLPRGWWRSWYVDGTLRSEFECAGPGEEREMSFYREDGSLSARGPGEDGLRGGVWTFFDEGGRRSKEGRYRRGVEDGEWTFWNEDGSLQARGTYINGIRVGEWERPGRRVKEPGSAAGGV